jgi:molecular chaperone DnaK
MIRDAEEHASEDKKRRELIEARNRLDGLVYQTENSLKEHGSALSAADKTTVEEILQRAKSVLETGTEASELQRMSDELSKGAHKLAEAMYKSTGTNGSGAAGTQAAGGTGAGSSSGPKDDGVVDADYEEVK